MAIPFIKPKVLCETCKWSAAISTNARKDAREEWRECIYFPPTAIQAHGGLVFIFPEVHITMRCGQWIPK